MQFPILIGTLAIFILLGAGCARGTPSAMPLKEPIVPTPSELAPTPRAEAPALPIEALSTPSPPTPAPVPERK